MQDVRSLPHRGGEPRIVLYSELPPGAEHGSLPRRLRWRIIWINRHTRVPFLRHLRGSDRRLTALHLRQLHLQRHQKRVLELDRRCQALNRALRDVHAVLADVRGRIQALRRRHARLVLRPLAAPRSGPHGRIEIREAAIHYALSMTSRSVEAAARQLGVSRRTLRRRMDELGISAKQALDDQAD